MLKISPTLEARYWEKVDVRGPDECWPWTASTEHHGHGSIYLGRDDGRAVTGKAHRLAWFFATGKEPGESVVRHRCDNPPCQNPSHLRLGTQQDNIQDMYERGRARPRGAKPGELHPMAKLTAVQTQEIRDRYAAGGVQQKELAAEYGVSKQQVSKIIRRDRW